jgi:thiazole synthase
MTGKPLTIAGVEFTSRLFAGTGKFSSGEVMRASLAAAGTQLVTVALRRVHTGGQPDDILDHLETSRYRLLPNTSGVRDAKEAILAAELAREALETNWLKLEIHPDPKYLMPDPIETLAATRELVKRGFVVLPYVHADPVLCKQLEEAGAAAVMPLGSPIGSNRGLESRVFLEIILAQARVPVVVDAGLGAPSHAAAALEMGADAVLVNTAIAAAGDPVAMADAFRRGVEAGRIAFEAGAAGGMGPGGGVGTVNAARGAGALGNRGMSAPIEAVGTSPLTAFLA